MKTALTVVCIGLIVVATLIVAVEAFTRLQTQVIQPTQPQADVWKQWLEQIEETERQEQYAWRQKYIELQGK